MKLWRVRVTQWVRLILLLELDTIIGAHINVHFLQKSLFPNVSPYIRFVFSNETTKNISVPEELQKYVQFERSRKPWLDNHLKTVLEKTGFKFSSGDGESAGDWIGSWNKNKRRKVQELREYQKIYHLPGHIYLSRKSKQYLTEINMVKTHGLEHCPFILSTCTLPEQFEKFKLAWEKTENKLWILKPTYPTTFDEFKCSLSRGIKPIKHWSEAKHLDYPGMVVQKYVHNPFLLNGRKVEIRLYVVITSIHPLKVFLSERSHSKLGYSNYSASPESLSDLCKHIRVHRKSGDRLCNLSMRKVPFENTAIIFEKIGSQGHNVTEIKIKMEDAIIKYILSVHSNLLKSWGKLRHLNRYNTFALLGFDFILDETMNPWSIEINTRPGLAMHYLLNDMIEGQLVTEVLNLVGYHLPPHIDDTAKRVLSLSNSSDLTDKESIVFQKQLYSSNLTEQEKEKQKYFVQLCKSTAPLPCEYLDTILENLTPDDVRQLIVSEDELARSSSLSFKRIFPASSSAAILKYVSLIDPESQYYFMLFHAWEVKYKMNMKSRIDVLVKLAGTKYHLKP